MAGEGISVPQDELLNGIYLTPDLGFAIAIASMPNGVANIDEEKKTIEFENPDLFDPQKEIFIYSFDSEKIPGNIKRVDEQQYVVLDADEIIPESSISYLAKEVSKYYRIVGAEGLQDEIQSEVKLR